MPNVLSDEERSRIDAYWRAANYLSVGQIYLFDNPLPVFGKDAILKRFERQNALFRIEPEQVINLVRSVHELSPRNIPGPAAGVTQALGFSQIGLAASQFPLRLLCIRNIRDRAHKLDAT